MKKACIGIKLLIDSLSSKLDAEKELGKAKTNEAISALMNGDQEKAGSATMASLLNLKRATEIQGYI